MTTITGDFVIAYRFTGTDAMGRREYRPALVEHEVVGDLLNLACNSAFFLDARAASTLRDVLDAFLEGANE